MTAERYWLGQNGESFGPFTPGELKRMWKDGKIYTEDQVCLDGTQDWIEALGAMEWIGKPMQGAQMAHVVETLRAPKTASRPLRIASLAIIAVGFLTLLVVSWWIGVIVVVVGCLIDRQRWACGACGNQVAKTSSLCPTCRAALR